MCAYVTCRLETKQKGHAIYGHPYTVFVFKFIPLAITKWRHANSLKWQLH